MRGRGGNYREKIDGSPEKSGFQHLIGENSASGRDKKQTGQLDRAPGSNTPNASGAWSGKGRKNTWGRGGKKVCHLDGANFSPERESKPQEKISERKIKGDRGAEGEKGTKNQKVILKGHPGGSLKTCKVRTEKKRSLEIIIRSCFIIGN